MTNILVTGSRGFLGKKFMEKICEKNEYEVYYPTSQELNLEDYNSVENFFKARKIDVVIHLAARLGGVGIVSRESLYFFEKNIILNYNIVSVSLKYNVEKFITLGSSCSYGKDAIIPTHENQLWKGEPENSYGVCKLVLLNHLKSQNKMKWVYLIPPNIYGPGDHFEEEDSHLIPATFKKFENALKFNEKSIEVWGDGTQIRDFIYVDDVVDILLQSIENDSFLFKALNLSTNIGISVKEIVDFIRNNLALSDVDVNYNPDKPTGTLKKILDNNSIHQILPNYKFKEFSEGILETCIWYKKYMREQF